MKDKVGGEGALLQGHVAERGQVLVDGGKQFFGLADALNFYFVYVEEFNPAFVWEI